MATTKGPQGGAVTQAMKKLGFPYASRIDRNAGGLWSFLGAGFISSSVCILKV